MYDKVSKYFAEVKDKTPEEVCKFIGGKVQQNNFKNCCSVRMSYAFNKAGITIPYIENQTVSGRKKMKMILTRKKYGIFIEFVSLKVFWTKNSKLKLALNKNP